MVKNAKEPKEESIIKKYEELLKGEYRKIINIVEKQGELLQKFKESDEFFSRVGLSRSNIYFKILLHKFLRKFPSLKIKSNFKLIAKVCKANVHIFCDKK